MNTLKKICLHVANFKVPTLQIVSDNSFYKDPWGIFQKHVKKCQCFSLFPHYFVQAEVLEINCGSDYGLEIPIGNPFLGPAKAIDWLKRKSETVEKNLECNDSKYLQCRNLPNSNFILFIFFPAMSGVFPNQSFRLELKKGVRCTELSAINCPL